MHAAIDDRRSPSGEAETSIGSCGAERVHGNPAQQAVVQLLRRRSTERIRIRCWLCRSGRHDRQCRFDRREGHDLERLIWPRTGSGVSTGLLQNSPSMAGRLRRSMPFDRRRRSSSSNADHRTCFDTLIVRRRCRCRPQRPQPPASYEENRPHRRCDGAGRAASRCQ